MIAVIFESWPTDGQKYIGMGEALRDSLQTLDGFISIERFRSVTDPDKLFHSDGTNPPSMPGATTIPIARSGDKPARTRPGLQTPGGRCPERLRKDKSRALVTRRLPFKRGRWRTEKWAE